MHKYGEIYNPENIPETLQWSGSKDQVTNWQGRPTE